MAIFDAQESAKRRRASTTGSFVFISYARTDAALVRKLQLLVWASGARLWKDEERIAPGELWACTITKAISECERMLVFWCHHSQQSSYVRTEYQQAIQETKPIVPIQLDGTSLPSELSSYQAIDCRELAGWGHRLRGVERALWLVGLTVAVFSVTLLYVF